jgi:predicted tellurium resistance membrane protein TerC
MTRMAYVALAFVAAKLLFEDLRHGHMESIAASIFLFALTLIALPRLARMGAKSRAESHAVTLVSIRG